MQAIHAAVKGESPMAWRTARARRRTQPRRSRRPAPRPASEAQDAELPHLTARGREVLLLLRDGMTNRAISVASGSASPRSRRT
ncbi:MAG: hypothetical protein U0R76_08960 [Candidatus Nanopelagicales bacterium]